MKIHTLAGWGGLVFLACVSALAAETAFDATVTFCDGQKTSATDVRLVYAWRELPLKGDGLVSYEERRRVERGIFVPPQAGTTVERVSFQELASIEFETDVQQRGGSESYRFFVRSIRLHLRDGRALDCSAALLADEKPVLWPAGKTVKFPENAESRRIERVEVSLQGKTKSEGQDAEFVLVFPPVTQEGIQAVMRKRQDAFPRLIEFAVASSAP